MPWNRKQYLFFFRFFLVLREEFSFVFFFFQKCKLLPVSDYACFTQWRTACIFFSFTADSIHILPDMLFHPHLHLLNPANIKDKKNILNTRHLKNWGCSHTFSFLCSKQYCHFLQLKNLSYTCGVHMKMYDYIKICKSKFVLVSYYWHLLIASKCSIYHA